MDEDIWCALLSEEYDAKGFLSQVSWVAPVQLYDVNIPEYHFHGSYDIISNRYCVEHWMSPLEGGYSRNAKVRPERDWTPQALAGRRVR